MAAKPFLAFDGNQGTNKKIREHQSFKEQWEEGSHESKRAIIANTDWVTTFIGFQFMQTAIHAGDKCIWSVFRYLSQSNGC